MRISWRYFVAPLLAAALAFAASVPVYSSTASAHSAVRIVSRDCPAGTNWDGTTQRCV